MTPWQQQLAAFRKAVACAAAAVMFSTAASANAATADWKPAKEITIIVGTAPGGGQDAAARALGVTAPKRLPPGALAEVPTWREQGYDAVVSTWRILAGPRGMTPAQIAYWEGVMARLVQTEDWKKDLERNVFEPNFMKSEETKPYLKAQSERFRAVLTDLGLAK